MKKTVTLIVLAVLLLLCMVFGFQSCNEAASTSARINLLYKDIDEEAIYNHWFDKTKTQDDTLYCTLQNSTYEPRGTFKFTLTAKGLHYSSYKEYDIPLYLYEGYHSDNLRYLKNSRSLSGKTYSQLLETNDYANGDIYINSTLNDLDIPYSYYDYIDKFTYNANKGYSIYLSYDFPDNSSIDFSEHKLNKVFRIYKATSSGEYVPFNAAAEQKTTSFVSVLTQATVVFLILFHAIMIFILIRSRRLETRKMMAFILLILSAAFQTFALIQGSTHSPYMFGTALFSIFAFILLVDYINPVFSILVSIVESAIYVIPYINSSIALPKALIIGTLIAVFTFIILYFCLLKDAGLWSWIMFALLCIASFFSIIIGAFFISLFAILAVIIIALAVFLIASGNAGALKGILIIFKD